MLVVVSGVAGEDRCHQPLLEKAQYLKSSLLTFPGNMPHRCQVCYGGSALNTGLVANIVAISISISAVALSSLFAIHQLRSMRRSNSTLVAIELLTRECRTSDFLESEEFVLHQLSKNPADGGVNGLPADHRRHVSRVGLYYSSLGALSVFGGIEDRMIVSLVPTRARRAWFALEPYIMTERALRSPTYLSFFEHLVCMIAEADLNKYHQSLGLRKIGSRSAQFKQDFAAISRTILPPSDPRRTSATSSGARERDDSAHGA
jgi:hypothetical protein